ncbi:MAG: hypothetical protein KDK91_27295, partial [Gammaproteobacteria bacterium]|nr:hypothetical protein [Gammaproteobacteria bacterium]
IQMHGGIGFTEDSDVGLYVKRAMTLSAWLGNSAFHRRRFTRLQRHGAALEATQAEDSRSRT